MSVPVNQLYSIPFFKTYIQAGFPSPAQDYIEEDINLQELLIQHPLSTFLIRVKGNSMINACIPEDALLLVDKSVKPKNKDIIVGIIEGEFTVKRLMKAGKKIFLQPENPSYKPIEITEEMGFTIWGVVIRIIIDPKTNPYVGSR